MTRIDTAPAGPERLALSLAVSDSILSTPVLQRRCPPAGAALIPIGLHPSGVGMLGKKVADTTAPMPCGVIAQRPVLQRLADLLRAKRLPDRTAELEDILATTKLKT